MASKVGTPDLTIDTSAKKKKKKKRGLSGVSVLGSANLFSSCAAAKLKSDELFLTWISEKKTQDMILGYVGPYPAAHEHASPVKRRHSQLDIVLRQKSPPFACPCLQRI